MECSKLSSFPQVSGLTNDLEMLLTCRSLCHVISALCLAERVCNSAYLSLLAQAINMEEWHVLTQREMPLADPNTRANVKAALDLLGTQFPDFC